MNIAPFSLWKEKALPAKAPLTEGERRTAELKQLNTHLLTNLAAMFCEAHVGKHGETTLTTYMFPPLATLAGPETIAGEATIFSGDELQELFAPVIRVLLEAHNCHLNNIALKGFLYCLGVRAGMEATLNLTPNPK